MGVLKPRPEIFQENFYRFSPSINSGRKFLSEIFAELTDIGLAKSNL